MLDLVIRDGTVVDGTGAPARRGDVGIDAGRIVEVGTVSDSSRRTIDATGRTVVPGFIDLHTHYDAQLFWDPWCSPSPQHGVTTVIGGNCGLTLAPAAEDDRQFLLRLLANVESIPVDALEAGVEFTWSTYPELLDRIEARGLGVNVGLLVGHAALRRAAMGAASSDAPAAEEQIRAMTGLLEEALEAGGFGFSTSTVRTQVDADGRPTPPRLAQDRELLELATACGRHPGTSIEFIPGSYLEGFDEHDTTLITTMSRLANRSVNWNPVVVNRADPDLHRRQLAISDAARTLGARIVGLAMPCNVRLHHDFRNGYIFRALPGWQDVFDLPLDKRERALADPSTRARLAAALAEPDRGLAVTMREAWPRFVVNDVTDPDLEPLVGRRIEDLAAERGVSAFDAILDVAVAGHLDVGFVRHAYADDDWIRASRAEIFRHPDVILGASDAGAHLDMMVGADFGTRALDELWRTEGQFRFEELVHRLTDQPAQLYGLRDRGRLTPGAWADVVVLDPGTVGATPMRTVHDLPMGAGRLVSDAVGIERVLIAGTEVVAHGELTGSRPGRLLRSGRDTDTVVVH